MKSIDINDMISAVYEMAKDEFVANVFEEEDKIIIQFPNGQEFSLSLKEGR